MVAQTSPETFALEREDRHLRRYPPGETMFRQGEIGHEFSALGARKNPPAHRPVSERPDEDFLLAAEQCSILLNDSRRIFDTLNAQDSINKMMLAARDLNR